MPLLRHDGTAARRGRPDPAALNAAARAAVPAHPLDPIDGGNRAYRGRDGDR